MHRKEGKEKEESKGYCLILILLVSHISSNAFAANQRELKGIPRTIMHLAFLEDLHYTHQNKHKSNHQLLY